MKISVLFILFGFFLSPVFGQIRIDNSQSAEFYIKNVLIGPGIEVGQIQNVGTGDGLGQFESDPKIIGLRSGLVLSTGHVDSVIGPNNSSGYTSRGLPASKELARQLRRGDKDLNRLAGGRTIDITVIEFDFVPVKNVLEFNYVFASEEYTEFVGSPFNDVFGFFLTGPGIKRTINLAVLPDGKTPISVNTINHKQNKSFFRRNTRKTGLFRDLFVGSDEKAEREELRKYIQFDGLTKVLTVRYDVLPYQKYHIKIAVGDVGDAIYDSGVFLEAGSFVSVTDTTGKYFKDLEVFNHRQPPNIDSILAGKLPADTVSVVQIDEEFEITDIYFDHDSHLLLDSSRTQLDRLAGYLLSNKLKCYLYGYTNNLGSKDHNQSLSERRAAAVMNYLISKGVAAARLNYVGRNFENPKFDNKTEEGRARNRRVEIILEE